MGEPVAHRYAAFTVLFESRLERIDRVALLAVRIVHDDDTNVLAPLGIEDRGEGRLADRLAGILVQERLGIKALHVTDPAPHEKPDDALRLRRELRTPVRRQIGIARSRSESVAGEERPQRDPAEAETGTMEKIAASQRAQPLGIESGISRFQDLSIVPDKAPPRRLRDRGSPPPINLDVHTLQGGP